MASSYQLTYKQFGERAILIEWPAKIQEATLYDIIRYKAAILDHLSEAIEDCIVGYNSLVVKYHSFLKEYKNSKRVLEAIYNTAHERTRPATYQWELPVCYDKQFGIDLKEMSTALKLSVNEIIELHTSTSYTVYFIGFLPGFLYLGGLDERLHLVRKKTPRLQVAQGAVAIGGHQTGVYPMQSAGGWHVMGNTPVPLFDAAKARPCFAKAGDQIKFEAVSLAEYHQIEKRIQQGTYEFSKTWLHA